MSKQIFISYRRADSEGYAGRLYDRLSTHFDKKDIFMDVDAIDAGVDFAQEIEQAVQGCDVLLALIGPHWLTIGDAQGRPRLEDPGDYVRLEIAAALKQGIRVIPVLLQGAAMPAAAALPDDLKPLARRNAVELSSTRFHTDVDRLTQAIQRAMEAAERDKSSAALGNMQKTVEYNQQHRDLARQMADPRGESIALANLGSTYYKMGEFHEAIRYFAEYHSVVRAIGDRGQEGDALFNMGLAWYRLGEKDRAVDLMKQALKVYEDIKSPYAEEAREKLKEWGATGEAEVRRMRNKR